MDRQSKHDFVERMRSELPNMGSMVVAHYSGLTVSDMTQLRVRMRSEGGVIRVAKNRLMKLVVDGSSISSVSDLFEGQTLIAYGSDPVVAPKVLYDFSKTNDSLVLLGGFMGDSVLDSSGVCSLARLPSLDELRGRLVAMITTPAARVAMVSVAPAGSLARVISAYSSSSPKSEAA